MIFKRFQYIAEAEVEFSWTDVESFALFAERNPHAQCQEALQIGGLIWGLKKKFDDRLPLKGQTIFVSLSLDELAILQRIVTFTDGIMYAKIVEIIERVKKETIDRSAQGFPGKSPGKGRKKR